MLGVCFLVLVVLVYVLFGYLLFVFGVCSGFGCFGVCSDRVLIVCVRCLFGLWLFGVCSVRGLIVCVRFLIGCVGVFSRGC